MPKLSPTRPKKLITILAKLHFIQDREMKGSHLVMKHPDGRRATVPVHSKEIPTGTLMGILKDIKISKEEFVRLLSAK